MPAILFVCTANRCRSPVAAALFRRQLEENHLVVGWRVESAGTWEYHQREVPAQLQVVGRELGLELSAHRARTIDSVPDLPLFDLILTMEQNQKEALQAEFPQLRGQIHLLSSMAGPAYDIADPIGKGVADYRSTVRELERLIRRGLPRILQMTQSTILRTVLAP